MYSLDKYTDKTAKLNALTKLGLAGLVGGAAYGGTRYLAVPELQQMAGYGAAVDRFGNIVDRYAADSRTAYQGLQEFMTPPEVVPGGNLAVSHHPEGLHPALYTGIGAGAGALLGAGAGYGLGGGSGALLGAGLGLMGGGAAGYLIPPALNDRVASYRRRYPYFDKTSAMAGINRKVLTLGAGTGIGVGGFQLGRLYEDDTARREFFERERIRIRNIRNWIANRISGSPVTFHDPSAPVADMPVQAAGTPWYGTGVGAAGIGAGLGLTGGALIGAGLGEGYGALAGAGLGGLAGGAAGYYLNPYRSRDVVASYRYRLPYFLDKRSGMLGHAAKAVGKGLKGAGRVAGKGLSTSLGKGLAIGGAAGAAGAAGGAAAGVSATRKAGKIKRDWARDVVFRT